MGKLEILVVDGRSSDSTREIVSTVAGECPTLKIEVVDNPDRTTPHALNRGVLHSRGDIVIIFGAHSFPAADYVRLVVEALEKTGAGAAGGRWDEIGESFTGSVIGAARKSLIGGSVSRHRRATEPGFVDTVRFAGYRREVFETAGLFDPELIRNQDDEFNYRVALNGYKLYFDPQIVSTYYARSSFRGLWNQLFGYGYWKPRVLQKNPAAFSLQFVVPPLFVLSIIGLAVAGLAWRPAWWLLAGELLLYLVIIFGFAVGISRRRGLKYLPGVVAAYGIIHLSTGLGSIVGLSRLAMRRGPIPKLPPRDAAVNRS
jgi:succinoglycan biosynthesis protein ExoA